MRHQRQRPNAREPDCPIPIGGLERPGEPAPRVDGGKDGNVSSKVHAIVEAAIVGVFAIGRARPAWRHREAQLSTLIIVGDYCRAIGTLLGRAVAVAYSDRT
jgi:hypothetical protein